ncbi:hypothetical protein BLNAU_23573 [Blattamonas nauphoetae]|uniref:Protein kinase domain-containing protein n=1 Tax=Blattamonas nauphoetae TaxID=2049346 RepID=A0ABQ9WTZ1_9EUKA|nr:hypothetical protein BLNAU_23573 [Blattamonas nauphoetae]
MASIPTGVKRLRTLGDDLESLDTNRKGAMIGRGSLGTVMRLHNDQTKEEVVMKHVKQSGTNSSSSLESTLQRLVSLRSDTLLPYLSYDRHDDGFDVFMLFWDKKTLGKHVERQEKNGVKLTEGQIYGFLSQIVSGLLVLHEHGNYGLAEFIPRSKLVQRCVPFRPDHRFLILVSCATPPDSSQRPSLDSLPLLSRINTATKGALDRSLTRHLSHSPLSTPQATDRAPKIEEITHPSQILVDSEKNVDDTEERGLDQNEVLRFAAALVPTSPELMLRKSPPTSSSEPTLESFTPNTKASRRSQRWGGEGEAEERGQSGRKEEGSVWDEPDSFPAAQPPSPSISASSARLASFHALPRPSDMFGRQGRVVSGMGGGRGRGESGEGGRREKEGWMDSPGLSDAMRMEVMEMIAASVGGQGRRGREEEGEKEGWRRKERDKRKEERGRGNEPTVGEKEHTAIARSEEMEYTQNEDVNFAAVSSLLSSLSSLSLSMHTTRAAMAAELSGFSAFVRGWETEGRNLGNEANNTQLEALMSVLQEEIRKTEELADVVAYAEYSKCVTLHSPFSPSNPLASPVEFGGAEPLFGRVAVIPGIVALLTHTSQSDEDEHKPATGMGACDGRDADGLLTVPELG